MRWGSRTFLETCGFPHVYYTTQWTSLKYLDRIRDIKLADPNARIAVIGYSMGVGRRAEIGSTQ